MSAEGALNLRTTFQMAASWVDSRNSSVRSMKASSLFALPMAALVFDEAMGECSSFDGDGVGSEYPLQVDSGAAVRPTASAVHVDSGSITVDGKSNEAAWANAQEVAWDTDYSGKHTGVRTSARFAWGDDGLFVLVTLSSLGDNTDVTRPTDVERENLYVENVFELFLAPDAAKKTFYYEIEVGPFGHYFDLSVDRASGKSDPGWSSLPVIATTRDPTSRAAVIEAFFGAVGIRRSLKSGAKLPLGLFRIEGKSPRSYLAWSPAYTRHPNFYVPDAFGSLLLLPPAQR